MEFSVASTWMMTKLFLRNPGAAARLVLSANIPFNAAILMILLAAVVNGIVLGAFFFLFQDQIVAAANTSGDTIIIEQWSPIFAGLDGVIKALVFGYMAFWIGIKVGGTGRLDQVMAVYAALQIAMSLLGVVFIVALLVVMALVPFLAIVVFFGMVYIAFASLRGLGHAVKEAHQFPSMWTAVGVILGGIVVTFLVSNFIISLIGPLFIGAV